ncbi:DUF6801 domain-containing protein [Streptomyces globisporus]|uniref:DUF6801 domain-containing protein n=1 Tax=Streptomyces globisporus TaxID=1908 RepID=UPI0004CAE723|nr:DUF6801 domain-containing protein [Streptomyces globisporus]
MRGPGPTPRPSRIRARGATIAAFVALAPLLPAAAVAVGTLRVDTALPYVCTLPSGQQPATVRITAAFPDRAAPGEEIRPTDVTTTVELPAAADLTASLGSTVRAETRLTVDVAQNEQRAQATWSGTAQPLDVPAEGPLVLTTTGDVPALTTDTAGDLTLTAADLALDLAPGAAAGTPATPASLSVACVPGQDAEGRTPLATVPVGAGPGTGEPSTPPTPPSSPSTSPSSPSSRPPSPSGRTVPVRPGTAEGTGRAPKDPRAGQRAGGDEGLTVTDEDAPGTPAGRPAAPPCVTDEPTPTSLSAYITGYSNVRKLNGATVIPVSCVLIEQGQPEFVIQPDGSMHLLTPSVGKLSYQGRKQTPPFKATFLTFGFAPATATMILEQTGPLTVDSDVLLVFPDNLSETYIRARFVLRVLDVRVNGTLLDVGPDCRTEKPLTSPEPDPVKHPGDHLVLLGKGQLLNGTDATGYLLTGGGPLTGEVSIPAFKGCGAGGENLDRLLTAAISGPGNHIRQIQGQTCAVGVDVPTEGQCTEDRQPYVVPKPER